MTVQSYDRPPPQAIYNPVSNSQHTHTHTGYVITFWTLGNQPAFTVTFNLSTTTTYNHNSGLK